MDDKWFAETFPQFMCGNEPLEPFYSVASEAYEKGFQDGKLKGQAQRTKELACCGNCKHCEGTPVYRCKYGTICPQLRNKWEMSK